MNRRHALKWVITYQGQPGIEYDLSTSTDIDHHISVLCQKFKVTDDPLNCALFSPECNKYVKSGDLVPGVSRLDLGRGKRVHLVPKPLIVAQNAVFTLKDGAMQEKKKLLFDLGKTHLKIPKVSKFFIKLGGPPLILGMCHEITGAVLSYALGALEAILFAFPGKCELNFTENDIFLLVGLIDNSNLNVSKTALKVLIQSVYVRPDFLPMIQTAIIKQAEAKERDPYSNFLQLLESQDVDICTCTLRLLNIILTNAEENARIETFSYLHRLGANFALRKLALVAGHPDIVNELLVIQRLKLKVYAQESKISYDRQNPEHENHLMLLWSLVFPNEVLESRISKQWNKMGFQGTDPATDFRGMGICGLNNLLYFAEHHTDLFRKYCTEQQDRGLALYPVATAGINVTQLMFQIFDVHGSKSEEKLFPLLFDVDYDQPFEETYSIVFQLFDHTWNATKATYMDFPVVIKTVQDKVTDLITNCNTVEQFQKVVSLEMTSGSSRSTMGFRGGNPELSSLHKDIHSQVAGMVKEQKISIMKKGEAFRILLWGSDKKTIGFEQNKYRILMLNSAGDTLNLFDVASPDPPSEIESLQSETTTHIKVKDLQKITFGAEFGPIQNYKGKIKEEGVSLFGISFATTTDSYEMVALSKEKHVNWISGLQVLMGQNMTLLPLEEEITTIVKISTELRLLDLEDFIDMIGREQIQRPEDPDDYRFVMNDNETIMKTADGSIPLPPKKLRGAIRRIGAGSASGSSDAVPSPRDGPPPPSPSSSSSEGQE